jgi:hypothetical protein
MGLAGLGSDKLGSQSKRLQRCSLVDLNSEKFGEFLRDGGWLGTESCVGKAEAYILGSALSKLCAWN